jgi:hypothetical protein
MKEQRYILAVLYALIIVGLPACKKQHSDLHGHWIMESSYFIHYNFNELIFHSADSVQLRYLNGVEKMCGYKIINNKIFIYDAQGKHLLGKYHLEREYLFIDPEMIFKKTTTGDTFNFALSDTPTKVQYSVTELSKKTDHVALYMNKDSLPNIYVPQLKKSHPTLWIIYFLSWGQKPNKIVPIHLYIGEGITTKDIADFYLCFYSYGFEPEITLLTGKPDSEHYYAFEDSTDQFWQEDAKKSTCYGSAMQYLPSKKEVLKRIDSEIQINSLQDIDRMTFLPRDKKYLEPIRKPHNVSKQ